ncbi:MAG: choice-of-anchor D domain-containing protein, partial [Akkermansiaceae bacterium]|nr:choice-of-anchor D domain-containing protein [Akkermansiaceae bacterium]
EAVGNNGDFAVARYLANGTLDSGLCGGGKAVVPVGGGADSGYGVAVQGDGRIVLVGASYNGSNYDLGLARVFGTPVPEIEVQQPAGTSLTDGIAAADFSSTAVATGPRMDRTFTIRNTGSADLTGLFASIDGTDQGDFMILQAADATLAPGAATTVIISFLPGAEGVRTAVLHIASNDATENPFDITLTGTGRVPPTITMVSPLPPGMVDTPYDFTFTAVGGTPPYTWEMIAGVLPDGLSLGASGILAGTPTAEGTRFLSVRVTGGDGLTAAKDGYITVIPHVAIGDGDPIFGAHGKVTTAVGVANDAGRAVVVQADGRILVAGYTQVGTPEDFALARYRSDGTLDPTFGTGGKVTTAVGTFKDFARCMALQSDGRILVAGEVSNGSASDFGIVRYLANGTLDPSFGTGGIASVSIAAGNDFPKGLFARSDGKIVVAGAASTDFGVARLNTDGTLDTSFGTAGTVMTDFGTGTTDYAETALMQSDGRIIVAGRVSTATHGYDFGLVRYQADGALDASFGTGGKVSTTVGGGNAEDICFSLTQQSDGRIIAAGDSLWGGGSTFEVVRYLANGSLDPSFGSGGIGTYAISNASNHARAVAVQGDGNIIVAGYANSQGQNDHFAVIRLLANGTVDVSFGATGRMMTIFGSGPDRAYAVAVQGDGGIVLAGESSNGSNTDFAVVRYVGALAPEIAVEDQAGASLVDGNAFLDFGRAAASRVLTVRNTGTAALTGVHVTVDGINAADFTITPPVTTILVPGASVPFAVSFAPGISGPRLANLHVASNDADENTFDIAVAGGVAGSPLLAWRLTHFGSAENTGAGADTNDYDHDGVVNLLEYAFTGDPRVPATFIQPVMPPLGGGRRAISFRCDAGCTDITYTVQASSTLASGSWTDIARSSGGAAVQPLNGGSTISDSGIGLRVVTVTPAAAVFPTGKGFLRVKVSE